MSTISKLLFEIEQERAIKELQRTELIRAAVAIVNSPSPAQDSKQVYDDLKRQFESTPREENRQERAEKIGAMARLMGRGPLAYK